MAYFRTINVCRIDASGFRLLLAGTSINATNISTATSLGSFTTDGVGDILGQSVTGSNGDIIEFSSVSYPKVLRHFLRDTLVNASTDSRNAVTFVVEDLSTPAFSDTIEVHLTDDNDTKAAPILVGAVKQGVRQSFFMPSSVPKNFTARPVARDINGKQTSHNLALVTGSSFSIPGGGGTRLLFDNYSDATTSGTALETLYRDVIDAGTVSGSGDLVEINYSGVTAANANSKTISWEIAGVPQFSSATVANNKSWKLCVSIQKVDSTQTRYDFKFSVDGSSPVVSYVSSADADFSIDLNADLRATTPTAAGDITVKKNDAKFWKGSGMLLVNETGLIRLTDETGTISLTL